MRLVILRLVILLWILLLTACAGPGERWACRAAEGTVVTCKTVAEP